MLNEYQKKENEKFFKNILNILGEGGVYVYPAIQEVFIKNDNKLCCSVSAYEHIKEIVTNEFLINFRINEKSR